MNRIRASRPSHATLVAYLALFVALSGTALAATKITKNDIKNGAVTKKKIHKKAVTGSRLGDGAVTTAKIADLAVSQGKLGDASVSNAKLQSDAVSQGKLQGDSVSQGKIQQGAVTQGKITGPIGLAKVAAVVANVNVDPGGNAVPANGCDDIDVAVPGVQAGDSILVLPRPGPDGAELYVVGGQLAPAAGQVEVWLCNPGGLVPVPDVQPVTVAAFR